MLLNPTSVVMLPGTTVEKRERLRLRSNPAFPFIANSSHHIDLALALILQPHKVVVGYFAPIIVDLIANGALANTSSNITTLLLVVRPDAVFGGKGS